MRGCKGGVKLKDFALWNDLFWPNARPFHPSIAGASPGTKRTRKCTIMVEAGTLPLDAIGRPHDLDLGGNRQSLQGEWADFRPADDVWKR